MHDNVIEFENVRFTYDGQHYALDGISLSIERGSFTCVLGGNGSGKSTLAKHVNALLAPDEGCVRVLGKDTANAENLYFIRSNAGMVFQNPDDQIVASVIEDDVAFGPENLGVPTDELRRRVTDALRQVGLQGFEKKETAALSGGQKQRVAIAGVLAMQPQILILDEASAMLDPRGRKGLGRVCRELRETGITTLLITHFMNEAIHADRVVVLNEGRIALQGSPAEVLSQAARLEELSLDVPFAIRLSHMLQDRGMDVRTCLSRDELAREVKRVAPALEGPAGAGASGEPDDAEAPLQELSGVEAQTAKASAPEPSAAEAAPTTGKALVEFQDVSFTYQPVPKGRRGRNAIATDATPPDWGNSPEEYWALHDVSFSLSQGEFVGIAGHTGSGKSTLIQLANGLLQPTRGRVLVGGRDLADKRNAAEARRDVGVVFQYPEHQLFAATVFDDVAFGPRNQGLSADEVEQRVRDAMQLVHLDLDRLRDTSPFALAGGQQRRVAFAGVLAMQPNTLVLDEPIAGLDPQARRSFLQLIAELHDQRGMTIVIVSHDMNDLARLCQRVIVLNRGELFADGLPGQVFSNEEQLRAIGLGMPDTVHLASQLGLGIADFGGTVPSPEQLADRIAREGER